uniref:Uncharacterized protein n=1 Tax=Knipowitschia caucasica TaxID=637954 RepID=A0AAV2KIV3_KNICA
MLVRKTTEPTLYREWRQGEAWTAAGRQKSRSRYGSGRVRGVSPGREQQRPRGGERQRVRRRGPVVSRGGDTATMAHSPQHVMWKRSRDHAGRTMCEA